jgi:hypothetical protein
VWSSSRSSSSASSRSKLQALVDDLADPGVRAVGLVDHEHDGQAGGEGLAQHEAGLRERALGGVDEQHDAVDHRQAALDLAAEVGVPGGVDDVDVVPCQSIAGVLGEDRDPLLALQVAGVHDAVDRLGALAEGTGARSMASTSVVLPWSTWATMATLRRSPRPRDGTGRPGRPRGWGRCSQLTVAIPRSSPFRSGALVGCSSRR